MTQQPADLATPSISGKVVVEQFATFWILRDRIVYQDSRVQIIVPEGFTTDFASVPQAFWNIFPPSHPTYSLAAIVHDRLYETHELSRSDADDVFYRAMRLAGTSTVKAWTMWSAVRMFGGPSYASGPERAIDRRKLYERLQPPQ